MRGGVAWQAYPEVVAVSGRSGVARSCALVLVAAAVLSACSGSPSPSGSTSPSPSSTASPSASVTRSTAFVALPESVLPPIDGLEYAASKQADQALARTHVGVTLSAFDGGISRDLVRNGTTVGGLQVYRFAKDVALADYGRFAPMMVYTYTGASPTPLQIGGKTVQKVDPAPGTSHAVLGWTAGGTVMILWADDLATAKEYAAQAILASV